MEELDENFENADLVLLLVSSDFIASNYCYEVEMKRMLERNEKGETKVIPIILRECDWMSAPFGKLQALPIDGKPVKLWTDRDKAWKSVADGLRMVIEDMRRTKF